jgi:hypothetical protein
MDVDYGDGKTEYGPGVRISLSGDEVAIAILAFLTGSNIHIQGPRTITVNGELCRNGSVYVDPSGFVVSGGKKYSGRGPEDEKVYFKEVQIKRCKFCDEKRICRGIEGGWICQRCWE